MTLPSSASTSPMIKKVYTTHLLHKGETIETAMFGDRTTARHYGKNWMEGGPDRGYKVVWPQKGYY